MSVFDGGKGAYPHSKTDFEGASSRVVEIEGKPAIKGPYAGSGYFFIDGPKTPEPVVSPYTNRDKYPRDYSRVGQVIGNAGFSKPEV